MLHAGFGGDGGENAKYNLRREGRQIATISCNDNTFTLWDSGAHQKMISLEVVIIW